MASQTGYPLGRAGTQGSQEMGTNATVGGLEPGTTDDPVFALRQPPSSTAAWAEPWSSRPLVIVTGSDR